MAMEIGKATGRSKRRHWVGISSVALFLVTFGLASGQLLVVDDPRKSDVILVLAGETDARPARALELLRQGYAPRLILDVPARAKVYQWTQAELAEQYIEGLPEARAITICSIEGVSTLEEGSEAGGCLRDAGVHSVLLVTSDYHTRRAISIFRRKAPNHGYSIAAAFDSREFGTPWWRHREWAKTNSYEWLRLAWWELVDRWR